MDSTSYTSGRMTAYFENGDNAQKARDELLRIGVPSSAILFQTLESDDDDFQDSLNRFFGSESEPYEGGSILTLDDPAHGTEALAIVQRYGGQIQIPHSGGEESAAPDESGTGTQSSGNP